ncbi:MAG: hypothetical protein RR240_11970 [Burkholderiaceae bacterium]
MRKPRSRAAAEWQDFAIGARYSNHGSVPGIDADIKKAIVNTRYANGWKYGGNVFNIDMLQSDKNAPPPAPARRRARPSSTRSTAPTPGTRQSTPMIAMEFHL